MRESIVVAIDILRDLLVDYEFERKFMARRFPGDYVESASKVEITALNIIITPPKSDLSIIGCVDDRHPEPATEI
jgi:hypothetical protein